MLPGKYSGGLKRLAEMMIGTAAVGLAVKTGRTRPATGRDSPK